MILVLVRTVYSINNFKYMLWFKFTLGLNFIFLLFVMSLKQWQMKAKPRIKLNHNIYMEQNILQFYQGWLDISIVSQY